MENKKLSNYLLNRTQAQRDEQTRKMVETRRRNKTYSFSKEHKESIRLASIKRGAGRVLGLSNVGKAQSIEAKNKRSESLKRYVDNNYKTGTSAICKAKRGENTGKNNPFFGKKHTPETLAKISARTKTGLSTPTAKLRLRQRPIQTGVYTNTIPERMLQDELTRRQINFVTQYTELEGTPDIFIEPNICVFADGDYWHSRDSQKIRDSHVNSTLEKQGYVVIRLWEHDIKRDVVGCVNKILS